MHTLRIPIGVDTAHYRAGAIVFGCIDDRFYHLFERLVEMLEAEGGYSEDGALVYTDRVIFAGGGKSLGEEGTIKQEELMGQIATSVKLHHTRSVVVTTHEDCGAYSEEATFGGDRQKQFLYHLDRHREIEKAVLTRYPEFVGKTRHFYLSANGVIEMDINDEDLSEKEARELALIANGE
jgi:hypothetical protein